jgi:hypothetical protein
LVHRIKKLETRPKPTKWTKEKGIYLIHAAQKWTKEQERICLSDPFYIPLLDAGFIKWHSGPGHWKPEREILLPLGSIIGSIEVDECHLIQCTTSEKPKPFYLDKTANFIEIEQPELSFGDYRPGRYAWICQNPKVLKTPIPYKGGQGYYQNFKGDMNELILVNYKIH